MHIAILSFFNPVSVVDKLHECHRDAVFDNNASSSSVNALVRALIDRGHRVSVITTHTQSSETVHLSGDRLDVYLVSELKRPSERLIPTFYNTAMRVRCQLREIIDHVDVVHTNWTFIYPLAALPFVYRVPTLCSVRDWYPALKRAHYFRSRVDQLYHAYAFRKAMRCKQMLFVANSEYTHQMVASYTKRTDVQIVPNAVRHEFLVGERSCYPKHISLISIQQSVDDNVKNVRTLVRAFAKVVATHPDARLTIVGAYSTANDSVYAEVQSLGICHNVEFVGKKAHLDLISLLDEASALVHPSLEETFGNIFLEAIARRLPVIGGRESGAVPAVLEHGRIGVLCDVTSPDSLSDAIEQLHADDARRRRMIDDAYAHLVATYNEQAVAQRYAEIYKQLTANNQ